MQANIIFFIGTEPHSERRVVPTRILTVLLFLGLSSCCLQPCQHDGQKPVLMPMAQPLGPSRRVVQQLITNWAGQQQSLLVVLELDAQHIAMSGISNEGLSLFDLHYNGKTVIYDKAPLIPEAVSPVAIINCLQLAYWPIAVLQAMMPAGWHLEAGENKRFLYDNDEKQIEVDILELDPDWPKIVELVNFRHNYRLHINTLSYDLIPE